jgi:hypothetical protein
MAGGIRPTGVIAWLLALVVPPAVAGSLGQRFIARHAGWAVVIGVGYVAAAAAGGFLAVVARDVSSRWQARLADRVDLFLQRKAPRFERRYREFVLSSQRYMDHKDLATVGPFTLELDAVFVNVSLVSKPPQQIGPGVLPAASAGPAGRRVLADFLGREQPAVLAVVGGPGSGKTTLMRHAARQACSRGRARRGHARDVPVLLYLRDHAAAILADPGISVAALLRSGLGDVGREEPPEWLEQKLREGRCLVLLDGLDEVARHGDRGKVSAWAERQIRQYPGNDFVISSRPQGYRSAPVQGAAVVEVCGLTPGQVEDFVGSWYLAVEQHSLGTAGPEAAARASQGAGDLLRRLEETPALYDFAANPLLLTMTANVHRYRGALPGSRVKLYEEICDVMLWRRQEAKELAGQAEIAGDKKKAVLAHLAYMMMRHRVSDLPRSDVTGLIAPALARVSRGASPEGFLAEVSSNGLLAERETGEYAFVHQTFQEYLAAEHIRDGKLSAELAATVSDDWWFETTLLFAAMSNADPVVEACLAANSGPALALAIDCTGQDSDIDPGLRERVNALAVEAASPGGDPERRRLFASSLLTRHMRQRKRTAQGTQVCPRPVTAEIYPLFMADTGTPQPDAPLLPESGVAVGMRSGDATAFAQWASTLGQQVYRLPEAAELAEFAAGQQLAALPSGLLPHPWSQAGKTGSPSRAVPPVLWGLPDAPDPRAVGSTLLGEACRGDLMGSALTLSGVLLWAGIQVRALNPEFGPGAAFHEGGPYLEVASALGRHLALPYVSRLVNELGKDIERARTRTRARDPLFDNARDLITRIGSGSTDEMLSNARIGGRTSALPSLGRCVCDGFALASTARLIADRYPPADPGRAREQEALRSRWRNALGSVLAQAIEEALQDSPEGGGWDRFPTAFLDAAQAGRIEHEAADPAAMERTLLASLRLLEDVLTATPGARAGVPEWFSTLNHHLRRDALPVFMRGARPDPEKAAISRMAALILAGEADRLKRDAIGDMFRRVAAGITLLEGRRTGERTASEVIMLALAPASSYAQAPAPSGARATPADGIPSFGQLSWAT